MKNTRHMLKSNHWRPIAYVVMRDALRGTAMVNVLEQAGWRVIKKPSGFHLVQAIEDLIEGESSDRPGLIVVDAWARGYAGTTIAAGLRDLGIVIPIVLVVGNGEKVPLSSDRLLRIVGAAEAPELVRVLAGSGYASELARRSG